MITFDDAYDALTKLSGYQPSLTPAPSDIVADAWCEHFEDFPGVTRQDLLMAVKEYGRVTRERQVQPADISSIARKYGRDRIEQSALDSPERLALEAVCDAKAADTVPSTAVAALEAGGSGGRTAAEIPEVVHAARTEAIGKFAFKPKVAKMPPEAIAQHQRRAAPPVPLPCPDCGVTAVPCNCDGGMAESADGTNR